MRDLRIGENEGICLLQSVSAQRRAKFFEQAAADDHRVAAGTEFDIDVLGYHGRSLIFCSPAAPRQQLDQLCGRRQDGGATSAARPSGDRETGSLPGDVLARGRGDATVRHNAR